MLRWRFERAHCTGAGQIRGLCLGRKLAPNGEAFRFDIPEKTAFPHEKIFSMLSGLSGEHGYPEALKLAHLTSVFSSIEVIQLQAAAINLYGLQLRENVRRKLFPM